MLKRLVNDLTQTPSSTEVREEIQVSSWPDLALTLLRLNVDWFWSVDSTGQVVQWQNNKGEESFKPAAIGVGHWKKCMRDDRTLRDSHATMLQHIKKGEPFRCSKAAVILPHLGIKGWIRITGTPILSDTGKVLGYHGVAQNITGQMMTLRKMDRLARHNRSLLTAIESSPLGIFICDLSRPGWPIDYVNSAFIQLTGMTAADASANVRKLIAPAINVILTGSDVPAAGFPVQDMTFDKKDSTALHTELSLLHARDEMGHQALIGIVRDVTTEKEKREKNLQEQRLEALGGLAGGMAHEINNLLQPALLNTEILEDVFPKDSGFDELLPDLKNALLQIGYIVQHTLKFARKNQTSVAETFDIAALVKEEATYLSSLIPSSVQMEVISPAAGDLPIYVNRTEFSQVFTNLVNNAVHAMERKGKLTIKLEEDHGVAILSLTDTGCGMSAATKAKIFEPFFTTKKLGEGTGLGLSVVHGLVNGWGGSITVESDVGRGSTFVIQIPLHATQQGDHHERQEKNTTH